MLSSRNIHFAILGIILGSATGYIFAFYQVQSAAPRTAPVQQSAGVPDGHPNLSPDEVRRKVEEELARNPNNTEVMTLYANFLYNQAKFKEAAEWFEKALKVEPNNTGVRTDLATALWNAGEKDKAMAEYQQILKSKPNDMATLHNLVIVYLEERNVAEAEQTLKKMEGIDPKYEGLEPLRKRLADLKAGK